MPDCIGAPNERPSNSAELAQGCPADISSISYRGATARSGRGGCADGAQAAGGRTEMSATRVGPGKEHVRHTASVAEQGVKRATMLDSPATADPGVPPARG